MPSIVDPVTAKNGAATVTRNLIQLLECPPIQAVVECVPVSSPPSRSIHRLRQAACIGGSILSSIPAKARFTYSLRYRKRILRRLLETSFDLLMINGSDLLWIVPWLPAGTRCVLVAHNLEHLLFASQAGMIEQQFPLFATLTRRERQKLQHFESEGMRAVRNIIFLSRCEAAYAEARSLAARSIVVPPVFCRPPAERISSSRISPLLQVGFVGSMFWWPNREGLLWFLRSVFPQVETCLQLHLFGEGTQELASNHPNILKHGAVRDLERAWLNCDVMICPMFHGGGVSVKLAEALYNGVPTLATTFAIRGLPIQTDPCLTVLDGEREWSEFLSSPSAAELRHRRISPLLANRFAAKQYINLVHQFLLGTLETTASE